MLPVEAFPPRVTYADLEQWPEDGRRYEIYDGEVFVVPAPLPVHQVVALNVADLLKDYQQRHGGLVLTSPIDIVFSQHDVLEPDVVFFESRRRHLIDLEAVIRVPPDLVVEVLSPSTRATDRGKKMQMFARYGVREYWLVDPDARTVEVHWLNGDRYALAQSAADADWVRSTILPDLTFQAEAIFPDPSCR
jgi:Uma2 family endonuclease